MDWSPCPGQSMDGEGRSCGSKFLPSSATVGASSRPLARRLLSGPQLVPTPVPQPPPCSCPRPSPVPSLGREAPAQTSGPWGTSKTSQSSSTQNSPGENQPPAPKSGRPQGRGSGGLRAQKFRSHRVRLPGSGRPLVPFVPVLLRALLGRPASAALPGQEGELRLQAAQHDPRCGRGTASLGREPEEARWGLASLWLRHGSEPWEGPHRACFPSKKWRET